MFNLEYGKNQSNIWQILFLSEKQAFLNGIYS